MTDEKRYRSRRELEEDDSLNGSPNNRECKQHRLDLCSMEALIGELNNRGFRVIVKT